MRNRILCLVLLGLLVAPAGGWAKMAEVDPDGQPASGDGVGVEPGVVSISDGVTAASSLWEVLGRWLESLGLSL